MSNVKNPESVILLKITVRFIWLPEAKTIRESSYDSSECEKGSKGIKTLWGLTLGRWAPVALVSALWPCWGYNLGTLRLTRGNQTKRSFGWSDGQLREELGGYLRCPMRHLVCSGNLNWFNFILTGTEPGDTLMISEEHLEIYGLSLDSMLSSWVKVFP